MRVFLTGFMGSGKSSVGRQLAADLGLEFVDLDLEIEKRAAMSIAEIFRREGETAFRARESEALLEVVQRDDLVVATGGGVILDENNRRLLAERGVTVWLNPSLSCLLNRLSGPATGNRPLLAASDPEVLWRARLPFYQTADIEVPITEQENVEETTRRVRMLLEERSCVT